MRAEIRDLAVLVFDMADQIQEMFRARRRERAHRMDDRLVSLSVVVDARRLHEQAEAHRRRAARVGGRQALRAPHLPEVG